MDMMSKYFPITGAEMLALLALFALASIKQSAYHNLKGKVSPKVTCFKGVTSKTFISFTTPLSPW